MRLLSNLLRTFIKKGRLDLYDVGGALHSFGSGEDGPIVYVEDNGIGIAPEHLEQVFGLFERVETRADSVPERPG